MHDVGNETGERALGRAKNSAKNCFISSCQRDSLLFTNTTAPSYAQGKPDRNPKKLTEPRVSVLERVEQTFRGQFAYTTTRRAQYLPTSLLLLTTSTTSLLPTQPSILLLTFQSHQQRSRFVNNLQLASTLVLQSQLTTFIGLETSSQALFLRSRCQLPGAAPVATCCYHLSKFSRHHCTLNHRPLSSRGHHPSAAAALT